MMEDIVITIAKGRNNSWNNCPICNGIMVTFVSSLKCWVNNCYSVSLKDNGKEYDAFHSDNLIIKRMFNRTLISSKVNGIWRDIKNHNKVLSLEEIKKLMVLL